MKSKVILSIAGEAHELASDCLRNWDDIACTCKRADFGGVTRQFTSKFEFVREARELLLERYLADGLGMSASISFWLLTNDWGWEMAHECSLDPSTATLEEGVFGISAVDNSIAALLKSAKSTKYEMPAADPYGVPECGQLHLTRLPMLESVTYEFTQGVSLTDGSLLVQPTNGQNAWLGCVADEIAINGLVYYNDDQTDEEGSYLVKAVKDCTLRVSFACRYRQMLDCSGGGSITSHNVMVVNVKKIGGGSTPFPSTTIGDLYNYVGEFDDAEDLRADYPEGNSDYYNAHLVALVGRKVYEYTIVQGTYYRWVEQSGRALDDYWTAEANVESVEVSMAAGDKLYLSTGNPAYGVQVYSSALKIEWIAVGQPIDVPFATPAALLQSVLDKVGADSYNLRAVVSDYDGRVSKTALLAAESVRGIEGAKFTTSFGDFASFMESVFGYTYRIGGLMPAEYAAKYNFAGVISTGYELVTDMCVLSPDDNDIYFMEAFGCFAQRVVDDGAEKYYKCFLRQRDYNDVDGDTLARHDVLLHRHGDDDDIYYRVNADHQLERVYRSVESCLAPYYPIEFIHRAELFDPAADVKVIANAADVAYSLDSSCIYASVEIGYSKKDYDSVNGRDEFNFTNTYSTGCTLTDRKLSLVSPYRADSYGLEFTAQKRGEDTTDSSSDTSIFAVLCEDSGSKRTPQAGAYEGTISQAVFNGGLSPRACVAANMGYIAMQGAPLELAFTASDGNSDVTFDGTALCGDLTLYNPLMTAGRLEFTTDDLTLPISMGDLVQVVSEADYLRYTGFINEVEVNYSKEQPAKYKLLIIDVEQC